MKRGILHARIPTVIGFVVLIASLWFTLFSLRDRITITSRAGPDTIPHNIEITNVSEDSVSVSFVTTLPTKGYFSFTREGGSGDLVLDDRDKSQGVAKEYSSHLITVNRLTPETEYSFKLVVNGKEYLNNGKPFVIKTLKKPSSQPPSQNPIFGKILRPDGVESSDTLVILKITNAGTVAVLTNEKGEYLIPTNSLRNSSQEYFSLAPQNEIIIQAYWKNLISELKTTYGNTTKTPTITLSNEYDFVDKYQLTQGPSGELSLGDETTLAGSEEFSITVPSQNETFVDRRPQFRGSAPANSNVTLILDTNSLPITSNASGVWSYRPTGNLTQGLHTITLQGTSKDGRSIRVTRNFEVFPEGSQVVESATPSATPRVSLTPTRTPTPTPTRTPTPTVSQPTPTVIPTITNIPSPTPTVTPTPSPTATPTPIPTLVASPSATISMIPPEKIPAGSNYTLFGLIFSGFVIAAGTLLFLLL